MEVGKGQSVDSFDFLYISIRVSKGGGDKEISTHGPRVGGSRKGSVKANC